MSQIVEAISEISRRLRRCRCAYMEPLGLKGVHARYLSEISKCPGISQDRLAQRLGFDKSNVARQALFLEENRFILRQPDKEDRRVLCLYPTERTREMMPGLHQAMQEWEQMLTRDLTGEEKTLLDGLLARVRRDAEGVD